MMAKSKIILLTLAFGFIFLMTACDNSPQATKKSASTIVAGKISQPVIKNKSRKNAKKDELNPKNNQTPGSGTIDLTSGEKADNEKKTEHYVSQGKIDPFKPLIQDKSEIRPIVGKRPKRILTPLEKIELSQIRLVAVIVMKNKRIAMVEEANGKGYEVGIGTYIGKNQGRISEIKDSSIVVKELVEDYKGRPKERVQEIKLHKNDNEE